MLYRLEIENFYSLRDPQVIDLRAARNAPEVPDRLARVGGGMDERAPKVVALFGANASGKSNVLKSLAFIRWFVRDSFQAPPESGMPFERFNDAESRYSTARLSLQFAGPTDLVGAETPGLQQCPYSYEAVFGGPEDAPMLVVAESLRYRPPGAGRFVGLFDRRAKQPTKAGAAFDLKGYAQALEKVLRPNASIVSTLAQLKHPLAVLLRDTASKIITSFVDQMQTVGEDQVASVYARDPRLLDQLNREIERIDLGIRAVKIVPGPRGPAAMYEHRGLARAMPAQLESHGTQRFVKLFPLLLRALEVGGVAVIDELDLAIHPLILPEIVRWFHDPARNPNDAQLWMTCQNASLLEDLIKEEVFFCEKDDRGRTKVYGLKDVQSVRRVDNHYRKYLSGIYGAVPHLG